MSRLPDLPAWAWPAAVAVGADQGRQVGRRVRFRCPFPERHKNGDRRPSAELRVGRTGDLCLGCWSCGARTLDFARRSGISARQFIAPENRRVDAPDVRHPPRKWKCAYEYRLADGTLVAVKDRFEPGGYGRRKDFEWRRPVPGVDRAWATGSGVLEGGLYACTRTRPDGSLVYGRCQEDAPGAVEMPPARLPLFNLPAVVGADPRATVWLVEGEKDVLTLAALGVPAACGPYSSGEMPEFCGPHLSGRAVAACGDNDPTGLLYAGHCVDLATRFGARSVARVWWSRLADPPPAKGDVTDWLGGFRGEGTKALRDHLRRLLATADLYTLTPPARAA